MYGVVVTVVASVGVGVTVVSCCLAAVAIVVVYAAGCFIVK